MYTMLRTARLDLTLLPSNPSSTATYCHHPSKGTDVLGQLMLLMDVDPEKLKTPACSQKLIPHLTTNIRGKVCNTPTTLALFKAQTMSDINSMAAEITRILAKQHISVEFI